MKIKDILFVKVVRREERWREGVNRVKGVCGVVGRKAA